MIDFNLIFVSQFPNLLKRHPRYQKIQIRKGCRHLNRLNIYSINFLLEQIDVSIHFFECPLNISALILQTLQSFPAMKVVVLYLLELHGLPLKLLLEVFIFKLGFDRFKVCHLILFN